MENQIIFIILFILKHENEKSNEKKMWTKQKRKFKYSNRLYIFLILRWNYMMNLDL